MSERRTPIKGDAGSKIIRDDLHKDLPKADPPSIDPADTFQPRIVDDHIYLEQIDLMTLNVYHAKLEALDEKAKRLHVEANRWQAEIDKMVLEMRIKISGLRSEAASIEAIRRKKHAQLQTTCADLGKKYNIDFGKITYCDESGMITELPPDPKEVAAKRRSIN